MSPSRSARLVLVSSLWGVAAELEGYLLARADEASSDLSSYDTCSMELEQRTSAEMEAEEMAFKRRPEEQRGYTLAEPSRASAVAPHNHPKNIMIRCNL